jgi:phytoene synthase
VPSAAEARASLARGSKSFGFAAHFLPDDQWDDAARVYRFCRLVDDVADDESVPAEERARDLRGLEAQLLGESTLHPAVSDLFVVDRRRQLDLEAALALIDGCRTDLQPVCLPDDEALLRYAYGVASTVGLLMCGVLGVHAADARAFAIDLGVAMQLTNICRDVKEDAQMGRVYLPATRLRRHGVQPEALVSGRADRDAVARVVVEVLELAERYYASAWEGLRYLPVRARFAILVASRVYRAIGLRLMARGGDALAGRTVVPLTGKLWQAAIATMEFFTPRILGLGRAARHDPALHVALAGLPGADAPPAAEAGEGLHHRGAM